MSSGGQLETDRRLLGQIREKFNTQHVSCEIGSRDYSRKQLAEQAARSLAAALVLLMRGVIVLHMMLNWITKGYHRGNVRLLSGLSLIAGVLVFLMLKRQTGQM